MSWALVYWFIKSSLSESFNSEDYIFKTSRFGDVLLVNLGDIYPSVVPNSRPMPYVMSIARTPPISTRAMARRLEAPPTEAL